MEIEFLHSEELKKYLVRFKMTIFIKSARKPRAFKPGDEWPPGAQPALAGGAEANLA
ncbi:MAG: hypothetical protein ABIE74_08965 [Pseudomonadota bacterium]